MISFSDTYFTICESMAEQVRQELSFRRVSSVEDEWHRTVLLSIQTTLGTASATHAHSIQIVADEVETVLRRQLGNNHRLDVSGSLTKGTYVAGVSDIDFLFIPDDPAMVRKSPTLIQRRLFGALQEGCLNLQVTLDKNAVVITENDILVQIVPALRETQGFRFPTHDGSGWLKVNPSLFSLKLSEVNERLKGKLVCSIRIAKVILSSLPQELRLKGYHLEVLAGSTCERYAGEVSLTAILLHLLKCTFHLVLQPLPDVTGQSRFVDGYMGVSSSNYRNAASDRIASISKTLSSEKELNNVKNWLTMLETPCSLFVNPSLRGG